MAETNNRSTGDVARAVVELAGHIKRFNESAERLDDEMIRLTRQIKWLTIAMLVVVVVQIVIAVWQTTSN